MNEFGVPEYKQHNDGDAMMIVDGKKHRYGGTIPWTVSPWAVANLGIGLAAIEQMCKSIPREAPWEAKKAAGVGPDQHRRNGSTRTPCPSRPARCWTWPWPAPTPRQRPRLRCCGCCCRRRPPAGSPSSISGKGGSQDARPVGGMGAIYRPMAAELGDALHLSQPVQQIAQDADGVTVSADGLTVRARRVDRGDPAGDRHLDRLRADAPGGPSISAPAHAKRRGHQDLHLLRRAVLACRRIVRPVGRAGLPGHADHRRLHRHRRTPGSCVSSPRDPRRVG